VAKQAALIIEFFVEDLGESIIIVEEPLKYLVRILGESIASLEF
jgi:hypothetical protein